MKFAFYGVMVVVAFFLGKMMYGPLAPSLLGEKEDAEGVKTVVEVKVKSPMGTVTEEIDFNAVDMEDYPEKVILADQLVLTDKNGLNPLVLDAGSPVTPLLLKDMILQVTSPLATHLLGTIDVTETNFAKGVAETRMARRIAAAEAAQEPKPVAVTPTPAPTPAEPVKVVEKVPEKVAVAEVEPEPMPEPEPEPEPAPAPANATSLNESQLIAAMKASLESGEVKELDAGKVTKWEAGEDDSFDGEDYQVGVVTYKEMTILGEKELQAKALFKKGQLEKWIHAKTGMEIR